MKELIQNRFVSTMAFLTLLFSPPFFVFAREARLDSGVIMSILAALFFFIKGWKNEKWYFWIAPAIAIGFLFKSVVALLAGPIILIYSFFYTEWGWIKNKYLWLGSVAGLIILAPWHIYESAKFGLVFWQDYLFQQVIQRGTSTVTGSSSYFDYIQLLLKHYQSWLWAFAALTVLLFAVSIFKKHNPSIPWKHAAAAFVSGLFILLIFTAAKTHLTTYVMPMFPFFAMMIAILCYFLYLHFQDGVYLLLFFSVGFLMFGAASNFITLDILVGQNAYEEREIGLVYQENYKTNKAPLYVLDWPHHETLYYYGDTNVLKNIDPRDAKGKKIDGPFYMVTNNSALTWFSKDGVTLLSGYEDVTPLYQGQTLVFLFSQEDIILPTFGF